MNSNVIGKRLRILRGDECQESLAEKLGISKSALSMYERGARTPRDEIKNKIANYFKSSEGEIFFNLNEH